MSFNVEMHKHLMRRIDALWQRRDDADVIKVKILRDHLLITYDRMVAYETKIEENLGSVPDLPTWLNQAHDAHVQAIASKVKFEQTLSSSKSTAPTDTKVGDTSNPTKQSESVNLQICKQRFLIKRIESLEILDDISAIKAEVLYNHLSQLYDSFISNQIQIEAGTEDDTILDNQQKITTEIQLKVIDFQTKLKKIMQPIASTSSTESNISIDRSIQPTPIDTRANLDSLIKKRESLMERISSLKPEEGVNVTPEKAEIIFNHLNSLYYSLNSIQIEIESQVSGSTLDSQLEISNEVQNKVIEFQTAFKKIFAPIVDLPSSSTQFKAFSSEQIKSSEENNPQHETEINISDISKSMNDHLKISTTEIQTQITSLQKKLNTLVDSNQKNEMKNSGKLEKILEINDEILDTQQKLSSSIIRCLSQRK
ncbi:uncharacterized protein LOC135842902 [Planococcus citri]|uniref:uncharacterized protein LOC135842902 n=1 Tax=Planococcus citri TaxID=170843 RepID=UPI0031F8E954